jgi:hypothetical protein
MRLDGQAAMPQEDAGKTAAQRSKRRCREISDRRMPAEREVLIQAGRHMPKAADDLKAAAAHAVTCYSDRPSGIRPSTIKSAAKSGAEQEPDAEGI